MAENEVIQPQETVEAPEQQLEAPDATDSILEEVGSDTQTSDVNWGKSAEDIETENISNTWNETDDKGNVIADLDKPTPVSELYRDSDLGDLRTDNPQMDNPHAAQQLGLPGEALVQEQNQTRRQGQAALDGEKTEASPETAAFAAPVMEKPVSAEAPDKQREVERPKEGSDAVSEMDPETRESIDRTVEKFESLYGSERAEKLRENLEKTYERLEDKDRRHVEDPDKELQRITKAMDKVMASDGRIDGKDVYSAEDRALIIEGIGRKSADPEANTNQGFHNTCAIQSKMRSQLETDPADVAEMIAQAATTGRATVGPPGAEREIKIHTESLRLDREARMTGDQAAGEGGKRDAAGQIYDLVAANAFWSQSKTDGNGQPLGPGERMEYRQSRNPGQGSTGEALVKVNADGEVVQGYGESPGMTVERVAEMSYQVDGDEGGVLVHSTLNRDRFNRPKQGRQVEFGNADEAAQAMKEYQERTGRPVQIGVMAGNLGPRAASSGHDLHAMTMWYKGKDSAGNHRFKGDNQWGAEADGEVANMTAADLERATDLRNASRKPHRDYDSDPNYQPEFDPGNKIDKEDRAPQRKKFEEEAEELRKEEPDFQEKLQRYQEGMARVNQLRSQGKTEEADQLESETTSQYYPYNN